MNSTDSVPPIVPRRRLHGDGIEAEAFEDAPIGIEVPAESDVEAILIDVEGVRVLHEKLAGTQHTRLGPWLVAELPLEVVPDLRQLAVGAKLAREQREDLFMGRGEAEIGPTTIPQAEQLVPIGLPAPRALPHLGGMQHRQQELLPAEAIHLLPHDALDLQAYALGEGK